MDNIVWHYNSACSSDFFIRADLSDRGMVGWFEQIWVKKIDERTFEIRCIPFFAYGIALGDNVETDDEFTLLRVISKSGHKTLRIAISDETDLARLHEIIHGWIEKTGLLYEFHADGYLAVDIPPSFHDRLNDSVLAELDDAGKISVELDE